MTELAERADGTSSPGPDPVQAVGRFFREDPARILAVAARVRAPERTLESTVEGMSMGRTLPAGSRIRIELAHRGRYEVGEVVAFLAGRHVVVHRVVRRGRGGSAGGYLLTRGDAALVPDPPVEERRVLGAVTGVARDGGWVAVNACPREVYPVRAVIWLLLAAAASLLRVSPRAAAAFVTAVHRCAQPVRRATRTRARVGPPGPKPPGAA
jgi:hypothetical protein